MFPPVFTVANNLAGRMPQLGRPLGASQETITGCITLTAKASNIFNYPLTKGQVRHLRSTQVFQMARTFAAFKGSQIAQSKKAVRHKYDNRRGCQRIQVEFGSHNKGRLPREFFH